MEQKHLSKWLRLVLAGAALGGIVLYALILPLCGLGLRAAYPEFGGRFWPWLVFLWMTGIPCFVALCFAWKISKSFGMAQSFTAQNAVLLKKIAILARFDAFLFFAGNVALLLLDLSHPSVLLASFAVSFVGMAVAVGADALSHSAKEAALLQEQSDLTI